MLHGTPYGYAIWLGGELPFAPFATLAEAERLTVVALLAALEAARLVSEPLARISWTVRSDLAGVRLTAAFAGALAAEGISCKVVGGYSHDHLFVQRDWRNDAVAAVRRLADA